MLQVVTARTAFGNSAQGVSSTKTGKDGTFEILHVPRHAARITVGGESVEAKSIDLDDVDLARRIEVVLFRTFRFRFEGKGGEDAPNWMVVLDADGHELSLSTFEAGMMMSENGAELVDGSSHVLSVSEAAVSLVLKREDKVLATQPLHLVPGEITVVHRER